MRTIKDEDEDNDGDNTFIIERARIVYQTNKAIIIESPSFNETVVIPKSVVHDDSEIWDKSVDPGPGKLVIAYWLAEKRGWV